MDHILKKTIGAVERKAIWLLRNRDLRNVEALFLICAPFILRISI